MTEELPEQVLQAISGSLATATGHYGDVCDTVTAAVMPVVEAETAALHAEIERLRGELDKATRSQLDQLEQAQRDHQAAADVAAADIDDLRAENAQMRIAAHLNAEETLKREGQLRAELAALRAQLARAEQDRDAAIVILADLADDDPCWHDHHGHCQGHGWPHTEPACPQKRLREFARRAPEQDQAGESTNVDNRTEQTTGIDILADDGCSTGDASVQMSSLGVPDPDGAPGAVLRVCTVPHAGGCSSGNYLCGLYEPLTGDAPTAEDEDPEEFCDDCCAGTESSEHHEKCVEPRIAELIREAEQP